MNINRKKPRHTSNTRYSIKHDYSSKRQHRLLDLQHSENSKQFSTKKKKKNTKRIIETRRRADTAEADENLFAYRSEP